MVPIEHDCLISGLERRREEREHGGLGERLVDLAQHKPELLHRLKQRAAALDATVYQSPGGMKGDPKSKEVARLNGGFWGPWQSDDDVVAAAAASADPWEGWREEDCDDCV